MLYVAENKRKTIAGLLAAVAALAIGFGAGRLSDPSFPGLSPQLASAHQQLVRQRAADVAAADQAASSQQTIARLRSTIAGQQGQITLLQQHRRAAQGAKRPR